jgi:hypothetical protein
MGERRSPILAMSDKVSIEGQRPVTGSTGASHSDGCHTIGLAGAPAVSAVSHLALLRQIDPELPPIQGVTVEHLDCALGFGFVRHLNETKSAWTSSFAVKRESNRLNRSGLTEQALQIILANAVR